MIYGTKIDFNPLKSIFLARKFKLLSFLTKSNLRIEIGLLPQCVSSFDRFEGLICYLKREIDAFLRLDFQEKGSLRKVQVPVGAVALSPIIPSFLATIFSQEEEEASSMEGGSA